MLVTKRVLNEIDTITNYENVAILEGNTTPRISKMDSHTSSKNRTGNLTVDVPVNYSIGKFLL